MPSVTTILKVITPPALLDWFKRTSLEDQTKIGDRAKDIGKQLHSVIEEYLKTGIMPIPADDTIKKCSSAFLDFQSSFKEFTPQAVETIVHTKLYAGTADCIATTDAKLAIIDLKTSKAIYDTYWLQAHAYAKAWGDMKGIDPTTMDLYIVRLDKMTGGLEYERQTYNPAVYDIFAGLVRYWYWSKGDERWTH